LFNISSSIFFLTSYEINIVFLIRASPSSPVRLGFFYSTEPYELSTIYEMSFPFFNGIFFPESLPCLASYSFPKIF